jgi:hypothetical protein
MGLPSSPTPGYALVASPRLQIDDSIPSQPERRRIVAQVRRQVPKNQDFLVVRDSRARCDELLTSTVDNVDRAGL